jgi:hypothetical protein
VSRIATIGLRLVFMLGLLAAGLALAAVPDFSGNALIEVGLKCAILLAVGLGLLAGLVAVEERLTGDRDDRGS